MIIFVQFLFFRVNLKMARNPETFQFVDLDSPDEDIAETNVQLRTPTRNNVNPFARYLTSSSAKRKQKKPEDCKFCNENIADGDIHKHLSKEKNCRSLYMQVFKVRTLDNLLIKLFACEMCYERKRIDFRKHLRKNPICFKKYQEKLGEAEIDNIQKKIQALKRRTFPSRTKEVRALDYLEKEKEREDEKKSKTTISSLNEYRERILLANWRLCVMCKQDFREYGARQINEDEDLFERLKLSSPDKKALRRFEKFFICNKCDKDTTEGNEANVSTSSCLGEIASGDSIKFFPTKEENHVETLTVTERTVTIMFPTSLDAINQVENSQNARSRSDEARKVYETGNIERSTIAAMYENQSKKYRQAEENDVMYSATIKDFNSKTLSNAEKISSSNRIAGSDEWFDKEINHMKHRHDQFGSLNITVKLELPPTSLEVIATCLLQLGIPITIDKKGLPSGEFNSVYYVHLDHMSDVDCSEGCRSKIDVKDFIESHDFDCKDINNKFVGTYVSSIHQKFISFARCIVEAPSSGLYSQNYHLMLVFDKNGVASIIGCLWPEALDDINMDIAEHGGDITKKRELIDFVEKNISSTSDERLLRSSFNLSEEEAKVLSELALECQLHVCDKGEECLSCSSVELPSLETTVKESCSKTNLEASKAFLTIMMEELKSLTIQEKRTLSTLKWLEKVWRNVTGQICNRFETLTITFDEEVAFAFEIDEHLTLYLDKFSESPLTAAYQYALSCCSNFERIQVVLQRLWIMDCYIQPFNPLFLKSNSTCNVQVINSTKMFEKLLVREKRYEKDEQLDPNLHFSHRLLSLAEVVSLSDSNINKTKGSTKVEYLNAKPNRSVTLKKVSEQSEENFTLLGSNSQFKLTGSNISRHFNRKNCDLLLAETTCWYDWLGTEKSKEVSQTYAELEVPLSDEDLISTEGKLPEYILCTNGDVMKKRSKRKIIVVPKPKSKYEEMYSKCLMFLPIKSEEELLDYNLKEKFEQLNKEETGRVVEINEKKMFPMKVLKLSGDKEINQPVVPRKDTENNIEQRMEFGDDALDFLLEALEDEENDDAIDHPVSREDTENNIEQRMEFADEALDFLLEALEAEENYADGKDAGEDSNDPLDFDL